MTHLSFTTLDVFTTDRYTGNPVAIIQVPASISQTLTQHQKQSIASEFNLSEIVFLHLPVEGTDSSERKIDIFTSLAEVPFAGHPTSNSFPSLAPLILFLDNFLLIIPTHQPRPQPKANH